MERIMKSILIASSTKDIVDPIKSNLSTSFKIQESYSRHEILSLLENKRPDILFVDLIFLMHNFENIENKDLLIPFLSLYPTLPIVILAPQSAVRHAVQLVKSGAADYLTYPVNLDEMIHVIEGINESIKMKSELAYLRDEFWDPEWVKTIHTSNTSMEKIYEKIKAVAPTKSTVLITGETGTGKGVIASLIHRHSNRREAQFISVHCGAIPDTLIESELFGHEKGAFTGAYKLKLGKFEIASGGTIFLDEVGTITPAAQIKLLQVLQDGVFQRVGGEDVRKSDTRTIAASNVDLKKMCDEGIFRNDLFYRLNVFPIEVPPLRNRIEDISYLAEIFIANLNKYYNKEIYKIHPDVLNAFLSYEWPGNIRELENLIERAYILEMGPELTPESFPVELFENTGSVARIAFDTSMGLAKARQRAVENFEQKYLVELLLKNKGRVKNAAEAAGITTRQLHKLMSKYNIRKEQFK
jgi:DNA-binding NtrC family response regulator